MELPGGSVGHISLTAEDQINLANARAAVEAGARAYPYHLDGALCALYPAADIMAMARAATAHKLYHTTYYNHLAAWVRRCESAEEVSAITYGAELPEDLAPMLIVAIGKPAEEVVIREIEPGEPTPYYRDEQDVHYVPKRKLADIVIH